MKIQLALDRVTIEEAIILAKLAEPSVDWIEVGTSLIKEYGIESIHFQSSAQLEEELIKRGILN